MRKSWTYAPDRIRLSLQKTPEKIFVNRTAGMILQGMIQPGRGSGNIPVIAPIYPARTNEICSSY
jgi:hypothetical protein